MATEVVPKENLDEKLGELKIEEPEKAEEAKEEVLEELKDSPPELHHVETKDTTDPEPTTTTEDGCVKAEVPEAFAEELKTDHDIVPPAEEKPTEEADTKPPSKMSALGDKITSTFHKISGKE
ncbi:unnamed protein product [Calypogeia fissa]